MPKRDVVVVGASAGGVEALISFCGRLPKDIPASVFIVLHTAPDGPGLLPKILNRHSPLPAVFPRQGEPIEHGKIYIAPPGQHLLVTAEHIELSTGPKVNMLRPSIDVLFSSAAAAFGPRVAGVILSGTRNDGINGLLEVQRQGGISIVQSPEDAIFPGLPENTLQALDVDYVQPVTEITRTLYLAANDLLDTERRRRTMSERPSKQEKIVQQDKHAFEKSAEESQRTVLTCPECGGVLWELHNNNLVQYACHVGHSFSESSLMEGQSEALEEVLWVAVRSLEERATLARRMAKRAVDSDKQALFNRFQQQAEESEHAAAVVRAMISNGVLVQPIDKSPNGGED